MAAKKRVKKVNYNEFISWLEGVESMQPSDWTPNSDQWKKIREKLDHIKPEVEIREREVHVPSGAVNTRDSRVVQHPFQLPPSSLEPDPAPAPPPRIRLSAHQQVNPSEHEGVPAATTGPTLTADGQLPSENEFL